MKPHVSVALAALVVSVSVISGHAEDSAAPVLSQPATAQPEAPASVQRPSIAPKAAEPATHPVADSAPERPVSHRHYRRYAYHVRYLGPFPIYRPELGRHRIYWQRISWPFRFG
jgi:hypothetical protein